MQDHLTGGGPIEAKRTAVAMWTDRSRHDSLRNAGILGIQENHGTQTRFFHEAVLSQEILIIHSRRQHYIA